MTHTIPKTENMFMYLKYNRGFPTAFQPQLALFPLSLLSFSPLSSLFCFLFKCVLNLNIVNLVVTLEEQHGARYLDNRYMYKYSRYVYNEFYS